MCIRDSNKAIPIIKQYFGANANNRGFDQQTGKELTQNGISTAVAWGGEWVCLLYTSRCV